MRREDLIEKKISKLENIEQALEMISLFNYDECIAVLNGVKRMPNVIHKAIIERAKSLKGLTYELVVAGMQAAIN